MLVTSFNGETNMAETNSNNLSDEEDPIVFEGPVFLSKMLVEKLMILQHTSRPSDSSFDNPVLRSRIKPNHQEVQIEMKLHSESNNFDRILGKSIAAKIDGSPEDIEKRGYRHFPSGIMDKIVLKSGPCNPKTPAKYAVGRFEDGELHLCPVKTIVQMQPSFSFVDVMRRREQQKQAETTETKEDEIQPEKVCVKFAKQESERSKKMKKMTYRYYMKKREEERWINTYYFPTGSIESKLEREKMICPHPRFEITGLTIKPQDYLKALVPYKPAEKIPTPSTSGMVSVASLKYEHWQEKLRCLLLSAKIITFDKLVSLVTDENKPDDVYHTLHALIIHAVMIRGVWIVKSEVLYPENSESPYHAIPAARMRLARDYLLLLFHQNCDIERVTFANYVKIPMEEVTEMLSEIAEYHEGKGWNLIYTNDLDFIKRFSDVALKQQYIWEEKKNMLKKIFRDINRPCVTVESVRRQLKKSDRESGSESGAEGSSVRRRKKSSSTAKCK